LSITRISCCHWRTPLHRRRSCIHRAWPAFVCLRGSGVACSDLRRDENDRGTAPVPSERAARGRLAAPVLLTWLAYRDAVRAGQRRTPLRIRSDDYVSRGSLLFSVRFIWFRFFGTVLCSLTRHAVYQHYCYILRCAAAAFSACMRTHVFLLVRVPATCHWVCYGLVLLHSATRTCRAATACGTLRCVFFTACAAAVLCLPLNVAAWVRFTAPTVYYYRLYAATFVLHWCCLPYPRVLTLFAVAFLFYAGFCVGCWFTGSVLVLRLVAGYCRTPSAACVSAGVLVRFIPRFGSCLLVLVLFGSPRYHCWFTGAPLRRFCWCYAAPRCCCCTATARYYRCYTCVYFCLFHFCHLDTWTGLPAAAA